MQPYTKNVLCLPIHRPLSPQWDSSDLLQLFYWHRSKESGGLSSWKNEVGIPAHTAGVFIHSFSPWTSLLPSLSSLNHPQPAPHPSTDLIHVYWVCSASSHFCQLPWYAQWLRHPWRTWHQRTERSATIVLVEPGPISSRTSPACKVGISMWNFNEGMFMSDKTFGIQYTFIAEQWEILMHFCI